MTAHARYDTMVEILFSDRLDVCATFGDTPETRLLWSAALLAAAELTLSSVMGPSLARHQLATALYRIEESERDKT